MQVVRTQGFNFGGLGTGGTGGIGSPNSMPGLQIMQDATKCIAVILTPCAAGDGSDYLFTSDRFSLIVPGGPFFAFASFQAMQIFGPDGCPVACSGGNGPVVNDASVRVRGFRPGALVADETFALSGALQTFSLSDPDWLNVNRVTFEGLDAGGLPPTGNALYAIDNVNVTANAVPEPASLVLLGTGLLAAAVRRRVKQRAQ